MDSQITKIDGDYSIMWTIIKEIATAKGDTRLLKTLKRLEDTYGPKWIVPKSTQIIGGRQ